MYGERLQWLDSKPFGMRLVLLNAIQYGIVISVKQFTSKDELVDDTIYFVEVHDQVQLASAGKIFIEKANEEVNALKMRQLVVFRVNANAEEQTSVLAVDYFIRLVKQLKLERIDQPYSYTHRL